MSLLAILFVILIIWRVCTILRIVATPDFFLGLVLNVPLLLYFDHCTESYSYGYYGKLVTTPAIFLGLLCLIFMLFKNKLIPRPLRRPISFAVSKGWTVTSCIVLTLFMFACTFFTHGFSPSEALICSLLGILMMIISNSARVPWVVFTNILLLGLVVYRADSGSSDGGFDFDDGGMDADLPDDSIWAGIFGSDATAAPQADSAGLAMPEAVPVDASSGMELAPDIATAGGLDAMDNWTDFSLAENSSLATVPPFAENPYMALSTGFDAGSDLQICDASGMPELTIRDGDIFNSENVLTGHIEFDAATNQTIYSDINHNPYMTIDSGNNLYSAEGTPLGHFSDSGNIRTVFDSDGKILYQTDKLTNTVFDANAGIIGKGKLV